MDSPTEEPPRAENPRKRRRGFFLLGLLLLAVLLLLGGYYWKYREAALGAPAGPPPLPVVPVVAASVVQKDVPIYLAGLGTVQALNTVTIHVRVDGQLTKIAFEEGQEVHEGDLLARVDPAPFEAQLALAEARKRQDEAQLANARLDLKRDTEMYNRKVISQQQYDTQKALVAQLEATVAADEATIQNQKVQLGYTTITAPISGRIGLRLIDKGNIVRTTDPNGLILITQLHPISVVFTLPEQNLYEIQQQMQQGDLTVEALGRENTGKPFSQGKLAVIDNQIDITTGTIRLKATFPNDDLRLWPGQFVNARLLLTTRKNGIVVPAAVIQRGPQGTYAFVIRNNLTVEIRPVKVEQIQQGDALVEEGLKPGERVVLEGQYRLQTDSPVKVVAPSTPSGRADL